MDNVKLIKLDEEILTNQQFADLLDDFWALLSRDDLPWEDEDTRKIVYTDNEQRSPMHNTIRMFKVPVSTWKRDLVLAEEPQIPGIEFKGPVTLKRLNRKKDDYSFDVLNTWGNNVEDCIEKWKDDLEYQEVKMNDEFIPEEWVKFKNSHCEPF